MTQRPDVILYDGDSYPTALHLFEALKYLPHRPDVARMIREAPLQDMSAISERHAAAMRPDWDNVALQMMDDVLYHKFRQHARARDILLATGNAPLLHQDAGDAFWGGGPDDLGENHMGRALERVRQRLIDERAR
ncbi:hypothetical protein K488DRAFT_56763 [Vararia minispora EC-137]|uniref:Uncharacterized protein n=1 Tax=Vararia minispora EC-137 TaxID=1314806 RepID=A0ACB8QCC3_9AGAM|nr:hypothetical protein K488DRAFT_56763 [Vararia minispora EC-137]